MSLIDSGSDIVGVFFVLLLSGILSVALAPIFKTTSARALGLFAWHSLFSIIYAWYVINYGGDMWGYYMAAKAGIQEFDVGTYGIHFLAAIIYEFTGLSFLGMGLLFGFFGTIGLLALDASLRTVTEHGSQKMKNLALLIVLLPSVSFWSAGLGKDSISFMAMALLLWASFNLGQRKLAAVLAILAMLFVRPHIAGIMIMALAFAAVFDKRTYFAQKLALGGLSFVVALSIVPFALNYAGVGDGANAKDVMDYVESRQGLNLEGGSSVDIANMILPMQMFTYVFRPLPFEAHSVAAFMASIDNMLLLYLFVLGLIARSQLVPPHPGINTYFIWSYSLVTLLILSITTANLGIAMRQKWMFVPFLMVLLLSYVAQRENLKNDTLQSKGTVK